MTDKTFFGYDSVGRPYLPPFNKIWSEDNEPGLYKGYSYNYQTRRFYINDIGVPADSYWESIGQHKFSSWLKKESL